MTLFFRALILGYAVAVLAAAWLHASGMALWMACCIAWIGGNVLGLALAAVGAALWPATSDEAKRLAAIEAELRLWDADLARQAEDCEAMREHARARLSVPAQGRRRLAG
jgi:hypothetical protein